MMKAEPNMIFSHTKGKRESIEVAHRLRDQIIYSVERGEKKLVQQYFEKMVQLFRNDELDIFKRTPENKLRSYKNIILSYNTVYSIAAEKGGLSAVKSHYIAEKYAILIESADSFQQIEQVYLNMLEEYSDSKNRFTDESSKTEVEKVVDYITLNFAESLSIDELAEYVHMHPSHLMRVFKKEYGITIGSFLRKMRLEEAKNLLSQSNLSVTEVALMVGFSDPQYFCRIFKKELAMTPKEYKIESKQKTNTPTQ